MEPRPHERGNPSSARRWRRSPSSFNGATSSRTWKLLRELLNYETNESLQWSHVLTNVETRRVAGLDDGQALPSMEPRPHERGNHSHPCKETETSPWLQWSHVLTNVETYSLHVTRSTMASRFNGATSSRTWKRGHGLHPRHRLDGFNGATSSRTWKLHGGRGHEVARHHASMEPRPHERGNLRLVTHLFLLVASFNGATSSRTWKLRARSERYGGMKFASMEPRPHERGNRRRDAAGADVELRLQWSHVLTNVETLSGFLYAARP